MKRSVLLIYFFIAINLYSQVLENFDDGDFTSNPTWSGDENSFIINNDNQIQLYDDSEGSSCLTTQSETLINGEWHFWVKLAFSPSSNNYSRFYLASNSPDLKSNPDGYFIQLGESGSNDAVELFKQKGDILTSVLRSENGIISSSFEISIKVLRDSLGLWKLFIDNNGGANYTYETEGFDNEITSSNYLGIHCNYTVSNSKKMYYDNIYSGEWIIDNEPPTINSVRFIADSIIELKFNEYVNDSSLLESNFEVSSPIGNPKQIIQNETDKSIINLLFEKRFTSINNYDLNIKNVCDLSGNVMQPVILSITYYVPQKRDIVINEIMADPSPIAGLPEYEYLELFNTTDIDIELSGWSVEIGNSTKSMNDCWIASGGYLILGKVEAWPFFEEYGNFFGFTSFSLTNGGQSIKLIDNDNKIISEINFDITWYRDEIKQEGGYSLELINHLDICCKSRNWSASIHPDGGTPGKENSIKSNLLQKPFIESLKVISNTTIELIFSQNMNIESILEINNYKLNGEIVFPKNIYSNADDQMFMVFDEVLQEGVIYDLSVSSNINNCMGINSVNDEVIKFGIPQKAERNDIVINEVLFKPWTNGVDYIEIFNRSQKTIDLREISMGYVHSNPPNPDDTIGWNISNQQELFLPGDYRLLTESPKAVSSQYTTKDERNFLRINDMPNLNSVNGHIFISAIDILIDSFSYNENYHFPLLKYYNGVSLEKITPHMSLTGNSNWHSASESCGFGTPGCSNSQLNNSEKGSDFITIEPKVFTPDFDGNNDIQNVNILFKTSGNVVSVKIYNSTGYLIRDLVNNEYTGTEVSFSWDGLNNYDAVAPSDIYIYLVTVFNTDGSVRHYKKAGTLLH